MNPAPAPCPGSGEWLPALAEAALLGHTHAPGALLAHRAAILEIAAEVQHPVGEVAHLYCAELDRLYHLASVADYLPILIAKRLREQLRRAASPGQA